MRSSTPGPDHGRCDRATREPRRAGFGAAILTWVFLIAGPLPCAGDQSLVPERAMTRDESTMLLASFEAEGGHADYARNLATNTGTASAISVPGRFGQAVRVAEPGTFLQFEGLDNVRPAHGSVEFWVKSASEGSIWSDGTARWLFTIYPERAQFGTVAGMAPYHLGLHKSPDGNLVFAAVQRGVVRFDLANALSATNIPRVEIPVGTLDPAGWHHILASYDLRPPGRLVLSVDGRRAETEMALPHDAPAPNPAQKIILGGLHAQVDGSALVCGCDLDDFRISDVTVDDRIRSGPAAPELARVLAATDAVRSTLDRIVALQRHGGWHDFYQWPTNEAAEWGWIGRGVNHWFTTNRDAGELLLRAWRTWGDDRYLDAATETARMYERTQLASGGWNFHYAYTRGQFTPLNQTALIAQEMQSNPIRFLAMYHGLTGDAAALATLKKAAGFYIATQGSSGWWGWRGSEGSPTGPPALNDGVTTQAIQDLFVLYVATGDRRCLDAMSRGVEWILRVQLGAPTFAWADQYEIDSGAPAWNRHFEPPAASVAAISHVAPVLFLMYDITGEDRFLEPLRRVQRWLQGAPRNQRGWLWYDVSTGRPVIGFQNEIHAADAPETRDELLPQLGSYGVRFHWPLDTIRDGLAARKRFGQLYPADADTGWSGGLETGEWTGRWPNQSAGWEPRRLFRERGSSRLTRQFDELDLKHLTLWLSGSPGPLPRLATFSDPHVVGISAEEGLQFQPMEALRRASRLLDWIDSGRENGRARGAAAPSPRYDPRTWGAWVHAYPERDLYDIPDFR